MTKLEDLTPATAVRGILPDGLVTVVNVQWFGSGALELTGFEPVDREVEKLGYDIESRVPGTAKLRVIEVKGRVTGAPTITVTKNAILYSLNKPDDFVLAIVEYLDDDTHRAHYSRRPFQREPDFGVASVNYDFANLLRRAEEPS
jgi:Domain of unknown function (DUF3883)